LRLDAGHIVQTERKAEQDVKRVSGVVGVVNNIEVRLPIIHRRPDLEIARDAVEAIKRELPLSWEKIKVIVEDGWITLEGESSGTTSGSVRKRRCRACAVSKVSPT
jgi:osmotically-inducible protein OsmY